MGGVMLSRRSPSESSSHDSPPESLSSIATYTSRMLSVRSSIELKPARWCSSGSIAVPLCIAVSIIFACPRPLFSPFCCPHTHFQPLSLPYAP
eukprot:1655838-Rhodomonas_salina.1